MKNIQYTPYIIPINNIQLRIIINNLDNGFAIQYKILIAPNTINGENNLIGLKESIRPIQLSIPRKLKFVYNKNKNRP